MDLDRKELLKINSKLKSINSIQSNNALKGLLRGLIVGMVFMTIIAYIGNMDVKPVKKKETIEDLFNGTEPQENLADFLNRKVRVLCFILPIAKKELEDYGHMFLATWSKRCDKFIFFSDDSYDGLKDYVVQIEDRRNNWTKLREALAYIYKHHMDDFDWILKAKDSTYVVMENLRWLLYQYDAKYPLLIGQRYLKEDYMKGVYALSKNGFIRLIEHAFTNPDICDESGFDEDKELSFCLQHVNVIQIDGIDKDGRGMFFHNKPDALLVPLRTDVDFDKWYFHKLKQGIENCCSDRLISMENIRGTQLYYVEYFIYKVHAVGRHRQFEALPQKKSAEEIIMDFI